MDLKKLATGVAACVSLLAGAPSAHAAWDIDFQRMTINDCDEVGTCDWNLQCFVGTSQMADVLIPKQEGNSGDILPINEVMRVSALPVSVACHVQEWDGGIGATWEEIGWDEVQIGLEDLSTDPSTPGVFTGAYTLNASSDEGSVSIGIWVRGTP